MVLCVRNSEQPSRPALARALRRCSQMSSRAASSEVWPGAGGSPARCLLHMAGESVLASGQFFPMMSSPKGFLSPRERKSRDQSQSSSILDDLPSEVTNCHFCGILPVTQISPDSVGDSVKIKRPGSSGAILKARSTRYSAHCM